MSLWWAFAIAAILVVVLLACLRWHKSRMALVARADQQNQWALAGDLRGVYGAEYQDPDKTFGQADITGDPDKSPEWADIPGKPIIIDAGAGTSKKSGRKRSVSGVGQVIDIDENCRKLTVSGVGNTINARDCVEITVSGVRNSISARSIRTVNGSGVRNRITYQTGNAPVKRISGVNNFVGRS
jgi:hypothetical protein